MAEKRWVMKVRILTTAANDLIKTMDYYESQSDGLGADFLDEYEKTISRICKSWGQAWLFGLLSGCCGRPCKSFGAVFLTYADL